MLKYRLITGPILIAVLLGLIWADEHFSGGPSGPPRGLLLFILGLIIAALGALELSAVFRAQQIQTRSWLTALAAMGGLALSYLIPEGTGTVTAVALVSTGMVLLFVVSLLTFSRGHTVEGVVAATGAVLFAMVFLGLMFGFLLTLRREHSAWWIVGVVLTTKACDTGAYFTGRAIGRHKLIPWLSPGKTWEGLVGGVVVAAAFGYGAAHLSGRLGGTDVVPPWLGAVCGVVFGLVGQFGDLAMSLLKRGAGLKDSSHLLPGLGGVLDVLDSPLMVAPVAFWLLAAR